MTEYIIFTLVITNIWCIYQIINIDEACDLILPGVMSRLSTLEKKLAYSNNT